MTQCNQYHLTFIIIAAVCIPFTIIAVSLRFLALSKSKQKYKLDEWLAALALLFSLTFEVLGLYAGENGGGYDPRKLPFPLLVSYLKIVMAAKIVTPLSFGAAKFSLLLLYQRVFAVHSGFALCIKIVGVLNLLWVIAAVATSIFQCSPVKKAWDPVLPGKCFNFSTFPFAIEVPNSLLDFAMMTVPIFMIKKLRIRRREKFVLGIIFVLGGIVGVIRFIRIAITYHPEHSDNNASGEWVVVQVAIAILCCCLPTYRIIFRKLTFFDAVNAHVASFATRLFKSKTVSSNSHDASFSHSYTKQSNAPYKSGTFPQETVLLTEIEGNASGHNQYEDRKGDFEIKVQKTVEMV